MENILLTLNIIFAIILIILILLQKSEGGALGIGVSQDSFMFSRSAGDFLILNHIYAFDEAKRCPSTDTKILDFKLFSLNGFF